MLREFVLAFAFATTALACNNVVEGSSSDGTGGSGGAPLHDAGIGEACTHDTDCAEGICAFQYDELCNSAFCSLPYTACPAEGSCVKPVVSACQAIHTVSACACDHTDVSWTAGCSGLPAGYSPVPIRSLGSCGK